MINRRWFSELKDAFKRQSLVVTFVGVPAILLASVVSGFAVFARQVTITDGEEVKTFISSTEDVHEILADNGYEVGQNDLILCEGFVNNTAEVEILRAFDVFIEADGKRYTAPVVGGTVKDAIAASGITLGKDDIVSASLDEEVFENMEIVINRIEKKIDISERIVPFEVIEEQSDKIKKGNSTVSVKGVDGVIEVESEQVFRDGVLISTTKLNETVISEPINQVVLIGTSEAVGISPLYYSDHPLDENGIPTGYVNVISGKSAAYSAGPGAGTASGRKAMVGYVAVDPKIIPYGTKLFIKATDSNKIYGYALAADTGTALVDGTILVDLFMESYSASCSWGIHNVDVYILG